MSKSMSDEMKEIIDDEIVTCPHRARDFFGGEYVCLNSKGARPCREIREEDKCKTLKNLFKKEQKHE